MDCCTLGWNLPHPELAPLSLASPGQLARADLVFLGTSVIETAWRRAPGDEVRAFNTARSERNAWRRLVAVVRQLRRLLRRGGRLICRLDDSGSNCRVRHSPGPACFPSEEIIHAYSVLARVHPALEYWHRALHPVRGAELSLVSQEHPLRGYLREFRDVLRPQVAVPEIHAHALPLVVTTMDEVVACAESQVVLLPPADAIDPRHEAELLRQAAHALLGDGATTQPVARRVPGIGHLRQRELVLERQMSQLLAKRERLRSEIDRRQLLARLIEYSDPAQLAAAAGEAFRILGIDARRFALIGPALEATVERVDGDSQPAYVLDGHWGSPRRRDTRSPLTVVARGTHIPATGETALIPAEHLFQAVSAVLREPRNKPLRRQIAQALSECRGLYQFEPGLLGDPVGPRSAS